MEVSVEDLRQVVLLIDVATARGAIRGDELSTIGALRDRLSSVVTEADNLAASSQETEASEEDN